MTQEPTLEWQRAALHDLRTSDLSRKEIAEKYKRNPSTIQRLIKEHNVVRPKIKRPRRLRPLNEIDPISPHHRWIGVKMGMVPDPSVLRAKLGVSPITFSRMMLGQHDFTLTDLNAIAPALGMSVEEIAKEPAKLKAGSR